ncbi:FG-GAP repeat protein [Streptomyces sp. PmtG]
MPPRSPKPSAGQLTVVYGAKSGPGTGRPNSVYSQDTPGMPGDSQGRDRFGPAAVGDVNGDDRPDLVINAPGEDDGNGRFTVLPGAQDGPPATAGAAVFDLETPGVTTRHKNTIHHGFGADFPLLDINGDSHLDVVASAPGYRVFRGGFWYFPGSAKGLAADTSRYTDPAELGLRPRVP